MMAYCGLKVSWRVNLGLVSLTVLLLSNVGHAAPPTAITTCGFEITTPGQYYLANDLLGCGLQGPNLLALGIDIQASHVQLRLNGHTISTVPSGSAGIYARDQTDILIQGPGTISGETGLIFSNVDFSTVMQVTATGKWGFSVFKGSNNVFQGNEITVGEFHHIGIEIIESSENKIINSLVTNHGFIFPATGIALFGGADLNEVHANIVTGTGVTGTGSV